MKFKLQKIFPLIRTLFSITVFIIVIRIVSKQQSLDFYKLVTFPVLITIMLTGVSQIFINSLIQRKLFGIYNLFYPFSEVLRRNFISSLYMMIIPGVFAPDFYLAVKYGEKSKKYEKVIISLFFNRIIGLVLFLVVALVGFVFLREPILSSFSVKFDYPSGRVISVSVFLVIMILFVFFLFRKKLIDYHEKLTFHLNEIKSNKNVFFQVVFLKLSFLFIGVTGRIVIAKLIGIEMSLWNLACVIFIVNLLISLPVSLNGIGVREAGYVGLLTMMGIAGNKALSFALFEFGIVLSVFLIGSSCWIYEKLVIKLVYGTNLGK